MPQPHDLASISHFENSLMHDGGRNKAAAGLNTSINNVVTDTSFKGESSLLSSAVKPREAGDMDGDGAARGLKHLSQTTQETSK